MLLDASTSEGPPGRSAWRGFLPFPLPTLGEVIKPQKGKRLLASAVCQVHFQPRALLLWGVDDTSKIFVLFVGQNAQGHASVPGFPVPAALFATAKTYEKLAADFDANGIAPPAWITWNRLEPGQQVFIDLEGPCRAAVLLGESNVPLSSTLRVPK